MLYYRHIVFMIFGGQADDDFVTVQRSVYSCAPLLEKGGHFQVSLLRDIVDSKKKNLQNLGQSFFRFLQF